MKLLMKFQILKKEFYDPLHSKIYQQIEKLHNKGMIANPITLKSAFENESSLSEVGVLNTL